MEQVTFKDYQSAEEFAEIRAEELDAGESVLIMKKNKNYIVTTNYRNAINLGYEHVGSVYNNL